MELVLAVVVGGLFAAGLYTMLRRSIVRIAIGLVLLGHAANLLIFTAARLTRYQPPVIPPDADRIVGEVADPLPQALILTAIVISFGVLVFALVLIHRVYQVVGSDDLDDLTTTDRPSGAEPRVTREGTASLAMRPESEPPEVREPPAGRGPSQPSAPPPPSEPPPSEPAQRQEPTS